jgi:gluconate 2-dehydrogenase
VLEVEPPDPDDPLLTMPNVVVLPHIGSATTETRRAMLDCAVENLVACMRGETCRHALT